MGEIYLVSCAGKKADPPRNTWLGRDSPNEAIRRSGLWHVNHTTDVNVVLDPEGPEVSLR